MSHTIFLIYITRANALTYSIHIFPYVPRRENRLNIFPSALSFVPLFFITRGNVLLDGSSYGIKFDIYIYIYIRNLLFICTISISLSRIRSFRRSAWLSAISVAIGRRVVVTEYNLEI